MIAAAEAELTRRVSDLLLRERMLERAPAPDGAGADTSAPLPGVVSYSTPRRLAVSIQGVLIRQPDSEELLTGPSWKVAFRDGEPTAAALAFLKKAGVDRSALAKITTPKGEYVSATVHRPGRSAQDLLRERLPGEIAALSWPKSMYWRPGKPEHFVRPVQWLLCLLDEAVIPLEFAGVRAGKLTFGHRILHGSAPVSIARPADYSAALQAAFVLAEAAARRHRIRKALDAATRTVPGARWREDEPLLEQVTHLTEWPTAVLGRFEDEYLALPEEVLVTVMRDHQKYFAIEDEGGRLSPCFLAVLNTEVDAQGLAIIRHGNERVLRARFNDARFFWNHDQKVPLTARVEMLRTVTFQKTLGSYYDKTEINLRVARSFASAAAARGIILDHAALEKAVLLAKTDLTTDLVKEFTELQGIIGGLYARAQGLGETVAQAISAQYIPASADDPIPASPEAQILGLADRMATIVEMFAIGLEPSGSKDPFALRRAGNGVIKILAESGLPLELMAVRQMASEQSSRPESTTSTDSLALFLKDRLDFYLREMRGYAYDVVNAVLAAGVSSVPDAVARAQALTAVRGSSDMIAISTAFKRIKNILRQALEKEEEPGVAVGYGEPAAGGLTEAAERQLHAEALKLEPEVEALRAKRLYPEALERIASLRPAVDSFFDTVMVMDPDLQRRRNRLALIASVLASFSRIADFSEIVSGRS